MVPAPVNTPPRLTLSSWNWTPVTPTLSVALAETVTVLEIVAPSAGAVMDTVGGVGSLLVVVALADKDLLDTFPAVSYAATV